MIKILKPDDYEPLGREDTNQSQTNIRLQYDQQSSESDDDCEVEVVDTESRGNQRVYQLSNFILVVFVVFLLTAFYMETHLSKTIVVDGIEYVQVPTQYMAVVDGQAQPLTFFVPESRKQSEQEVAKVAQLCLKYRSRDCWKEILLYRKAMFPEIQRWMEEYLEEHTNHIMVMWEESLSLAILLANLKAERKHSIDVYFKEDDSSLYLECLKLNLRRFSLEHNIRFMRLPRLTVGVLRQYDLVIANKDLFHKVIQPELLQLSVTTGRGESASGSIYEFTLSTKLLIIYDQFPTYEESLIIDMLYNQPIRLSLSAQGWLTEEEIGTFREESNVILLDKRQRFVDTKSKPIQEEIEGPKEEISLSNNATLQPLITALQEIRRLQPSRLLRFFQCTLTSKNLTPEGAAYSTEFRGLSLLKTAENERDSQLSHIYNFILQYLLAADYCNVLLAGDEEMLANIVTILNTGQVYLPSIINSSWPRIQASLNLNGLGRHLKKIEIGSDFDDFLRYNQIGLALLAPETLSLFNKIFRRAIQGNMNLLIRLDGVDTDNLLRPFIEDYYVFIISQDPFRDFDTLCVRNFVVQYFAGGQPPRNSFALITKNDILIEQPNPLLYPNATIERIVRKTRHRCFHDFRSDPTQVNLQGGERIVAVSGKISLFVEGSAQSANAVVHAEEGIVQFLSDTLIVSDKLMVYSHPAPSMLVLVHILKHLQAHGQVYLSGLSAEQITALQRNANINNLSSFYELVDLSFDPLASFVRDTKITVLLTSIEQLKKEKQLLSYLTKGSMVLLKYESSDKEFLQILGNFPSFNFLEIISNKDKPNQFGLCCSYKTANYQQSQLANFKPAVSTWMAILT